MAYTYEIGVREVLIPELVGGYSVGDKEYGSYLVKGTYFGDSFNTISHELGVAYTEHPSFGASTD